jgi:nucleotide-binding universal stress UspA family protein
MSMLGIVRILVPVDFSEPSRKAIRYGLSLAGEADATVILAHVVPFAPPVPYSHPFEGRKMTESEREGILGKLGEQVGPDLRGSVQTEMVVKSGDIQDGLLEAADENDVDLIVMGTHGRRRFERWLLGSVTEGVLRRASVPVLTVSHLDPEHTIREPMPIPLERILCATDLSAGSVEAVRRAADWGRELGAEVIVLHVMPPVQWAWGAEHVRLDFEVDTDAIRKGVARRFHEAILDAIRQDPRVRTEIREGIPYEVVLQVAEDEQADLIVLTTSSRPGIDRALLGSTAERVIRGARVPVLSYPPAGAREEVKARKGTSGSILI